MKQVNPEQLRNTITEIDGLAQTAFDQIASMARLALLAMDQPRTYSPGGMESIAHILTAITGAADDIGNCINASAERVGCNYVDEARQRRGDATRSAAQFNVVGRV